MIGVITVMPTFQIWQITTPLSYTEHVVIVCSFMQYVVIHDINFACINVKNNHYSFYHTAFPDAKGKYRAQTTFQVSGKSKCPHVPYIHIIGDTLRECFEVLIY